MTIIVAIGRFTLLLYHVNSLCFGRVLDRAS